MTIKPTTIKALGVFTAIAAVLFFSSGQIQGTSIAVLSLICLLATVPILCFALAKAMEQIELQRAQLNALANEIRALKGQPAAPAAPSVLSRIRPIHPIDAP